MGLFKRTFASLGLVALLCVSGVALADDDVNDALDDTLVQPVNGDGADGSGGSTGNEGQPDPDTPSDTPSDLAPNGAPICPTLRDAESIDVEGVLVDYVATGTEGFEFHSGIVEANDIDENALLEAFMANGFVSYEEFVDFLKPFDDPAIDLSEVHGIQSVIVTHTWGGTCTGDDWHGSAALAASQYTFEVVFPIVSNLVYEMPLYFDGKELQSYVPLKKNDIDPNFERLVALHGKEISIDEFLTVMGEMEASIDDFPKVGEAYGKHEVTFADYEDTWSVVTVVYPEKDSGSQPTLKPQNPTPAPQQPKPPATNSQTGNSGNVSVLRASDMSYRQFRGNDANLTPIAPAPSQTTSVTSEPAKNDNGADNPVTTAPKLPVTSDDKAGAALVTDDNSTASQAALLALVACVIFGIVAAASVVGVRRAMKARD